VTALTGPLRRRDLRLLVAGSTVSLVGDGIYTVALAVAVLTVSPTAGALAAVSVAGVLPRVAFGLVGGVLADRVSRRAILVVCDLVRAAVVTALGLLLLAGSPPLWALVALVVPLGAASGAAAPTFSALLPDLVDEDELVAANSVLGSVSPLAHMVAGPVLGGVLAAYDVGLAMLADAATFAVSAGCVLLLRPAVRHARGPRPLPWAHFREGLAYVRSTPWLSTNLLCGLVITFAVSGAMTMLPLLVREGYGAPTAAFGYLLAVGGGAATLTAVVVGSRRPPARPLAASYVVYAVGLAGIAGLGLAAGPVTAAAFVVLLFVGATAGNLFQDSVLGSRVPRDLRGRVSSLDWVAATAAAPLSVTVAAGLAGLVGIRATYVGAGVVASAASLLGLALLVRTGEPGDAGPASPVGQKSLASASSSPRSAS
jgi:MFS family permease